MTLLEEENEYLTSEALKNVSILDTFIIKYQETSHKMKNMILSVRPKFTIKSPKKDYLFMFP